MLINDFTALLATALYGVLLVGTLLYNVRFRRSWTHPIILITIWEFVFIFSDALYTSVTGLYGPSEVDRQLLISSVASKAILMWMGLHVAMLAIFELLEASIIARRRAKQERDAECISKLELDASTGTLFLTFLVTLGVILVLVGPYASSSLVELWGTRNIVFSNGGGALLIGGQMFRYGLILWLALRWKDNLRTPRIVVVAMVLVAMTFEITTNSRSSIVFGLILPLAIVYDRYRKKIPLGKLAILSMVLLLLFGVMYRSVVRDQYFAANRGVPVTQVISENISGLPEFFWGGYEASSLDGTIVIIERYQSEKLFGETFLAALTAPVPRPLLGEAKPAGGASTEFTQRFFPEVYQNSSRTEYSASFVGELYMNFGLAGSVLGGAGLGLWIYALTKLYERRLPLATLAYGIALGRTFSLLRGDSFNFVAQMSASLLAVVLILILLWLLKESLSALARGQVAQGHSKL